MKSILHLAACCGLLMLSTMPNAGAQIHSIPRQSVPSVSSRPISQLRWVSNGLPQARYHTAKITAIASRIIAIYDGVGTATGVLQNSDSSSITYSGQRGGDLSHYNNRPFDTSTYYLWDVSGASWTPSSRSIQMFNASNQDTLEIEQTAAAGTWVNTYQYHFAPDAAGNDTLTRSDSFNTATGKFVPSMKAHNQYNASGQLLSYFNSFWSNTTMSYSVPAERVTFTYNAAGKKLSFLYESYFAGSWIIAGRETYTYDAANNNLSDQYESYTGSALLNNSLVLYTYDAANHVTSTTHQNWNATTSTWDNFSRDLFTYDVAGNQISDVNQTGNGTSWNSVDSISQSYDASGRVLVYMLYNNTGGTWVPAWRSASTYTATGKEDTTLIENYLTATSGWQKNQQSTHSYNSFDQETRNTIQTWNGSAWEYGANASEHRYYYETYDNNLSVAQAAGLNAADIKVYPVPAHGQAEAAIFFRQPQSFSATITDVAGRVEMRWTDNAAGLYRHTIITDGLANGIYYLHVQGSNCNAVRSFVVQH